jgi:hypothetical protein
MSYIASLIGSEKEKKSIPAPEWEEHELYYRTKIQQIRISPGVTPTDIKVIISQIDELLSEASYDYYSTKQALDEMVSRTDVAEKEFYLRARADGAVEWPRSDGVVVKIKVTDEVAKSWAKTKVAQDPTLTNRLLETRRRFGFMDRLFKDLELKRDSLVTDSGVLKLEAGLK